MTESIHLPQLPPPFQLRPMTLDDLDAVMVIESQANPTPFPRTGYEHELKHNDMAFYQLLEQVSAEGVTLVGYVGHWIMVDECHISMVAVEPALRGNGYGKLLLTSSLLVSVQQQAVLATLEVRENNIVAQTLYESMGFELVGRRKRYYKDTGEDGLIMTVPTLDTAYQSRLQDEWSRCLTRLPN